MATRRYKLNPGEAYNQIVEEVGVATNSKSVELTIDLGNVVSGGTSQMTKVEVLNALKKIEQHIITHSWPSA